MSAGRVVDVHTDLLDRQLVDRDGALCGKVDDVELTRSDNGALHVSALLVGPIALAPRFGRRLGRWLTHLAQHAAGDLARGPCRVDVSHVREIGSAIMLDATADELGLNQGDSWVADKIIGRLPGADHAGH